MLDQSLQTPVKIKVEGEEIHIEANSVNQESLIAADMEDSEFGSFVSISNTNPDTTEIASIDQQSELPQANDLATKSEHAEVLGQTDAFSLSQEQNDSSGHTNTEKLNDGTPNTVVPPDQPVSAVPSGVPAVDSEHPLPPELESITVDSPVKGVKKINKNPVVDRLSLKKTATKTTANKEKTGKKVTKKESHKKTKKTKNKAEYVDDNQSELSYQPDTDLSRSKASKRVNGKLLCTYVCSM